MCEDAMPSRRETRRARPGSGAVFRRGEGRPPARAEDAGVETLHRVRAPVRDGPRGIGGKGRFGECGREDPEAWGRAGGAEAPAAEALLLGRRTTRGSPRDGRPGVMRGRTGSTP